MKMKPPRKVRTSNCDRIDPASSASIIMEKFGGLGNFCKIAASEGEKLPTSTVWGWVLRGHIPPKKQPIVKNLAKAAKVKLSDSDFIPKL